MEKTTLCLKNVHYFTLEYLSQKSTYFNSFFIQKILSKLHIQGL